MTFNLAEYKCLSFDIYGTLIDWELGIYQALLPLLFKLPLRSPHHPSKHPEEETRAFILDAYTKLELETQKESPTLTYPKVLSSVYKRLSSQLSLPESEADAEEFGGTIGSWPAFPDTVAAMQELGKHYKLIVLSNVDNASFSRTLSGPLSGVKFDAIYTAETIGSYKPDLRNFQYLVENAEKHFGAKKKEVLMVAQSLMHDHRSVKKFGMKPSVWIKRGGDNAAMGGLLSDVRGEVDLAATYATLGGFAADVKKAFVGETLPI